MQATTGPQPSWTVRGIASDYLLILRHHRSQDDPTHQVPPSFAFWTVDELLRSSHSEFIWDIYEALGEVRPSDLTTFQLAQARRRVALRVTQALSSGELVLVPLARLPLDAQRHSQPPVPVIAPEPESSPTFVAIELVDPSGRPMAGTRYRVTLPNGATREGRLNSNGYARVDDVVPGECTVTFPDIDASHVRPKK